MAAILDSMPLFKIGLYDAIGAKEGPILLTANGRMDGRDHKKILVGYFLCFGSSKLPTWVYWWVWSNRLK